MTQFNNNAEGGSNGTAVTTGNSGGTSGTAWGTVNKVTGAGTPVINFSSTQKAHGSLAYLIQKPTATDVAQLITPSALNSSNGALRFYMYLNSLPSTTVDICTIRNTTAVMGKLQIIGTNKLRASDSAGTPVTHDFATTLVANTWYRVEVVAQPGAGTGRLQVAYYALDSVTPVDTAWDSGTTLTLGSANIDNFRFGGISNAVGVLDAYFDDFAWQDAAASTFIGPIASPPTAAFTSTASALAVAFDGSGSAASSGSIASYAWDFGDSTSGTGVTPSHTYASAGTYTVALTVTDTNSLTGSVSHSVTVAAASPSGTISSITVSAGWTPSSGTVASVLSDGDATTLDTSSAGPTALELTGVLTSLVAPATGQPLRLLIKIDRLSSSAGTFDASIIEGSTTRSTVTGVAIPAGSGGSVTTTTTVNFPWTDVQAISSWSALKLKLLVTAS